MKLRRRLWLVLAILGSAALLVAIVLVTRPIRVSLDTPGSNPLARRAQILLRHPARVTVTIRGLDDNDLTRVSDELSREHTVDLLGLYADHRNEIVVRAEEETGRIRERRVVARTKALPASYPEPSIDPIRPEVIAPGMTFLILGHYEEDGDYVALPSAIDAYGRVRWYYDGDVGHVLWRTEVGTLLVSNTDELFEITMLGEQTGRTWPIPEGIHHDAEILPDGNFLALTTAPGSFEDGVVEIDPDDGSVVRDWDFRTILDPARPRQPVNLGEEDWLHLNGIDYDPRSGEIVVSGRDQSAVVAIDRTTGELRWILGSHQFWADRFAPFLLDPLGEPFEWQWGQHAPMVHPDDPNRLLVYDNGNKRSYDSPLEPRENYSRAVEYEIDRDAMTVRQVWEYGRRYGFELYTPFIGDADYLDNGNRLVAFGGITRSLEGEPVEIFDYEAGTVRRMKIWARIVEVTSDSPANEVWSVSFADPDADSYRGYRVYRAVRMPLYPGDE
jgi:arylsulfate sulfotransferase